MCMSFSRSTSPSSQGEHFTPFTIYSVGPFQQTSRPPSIYSVSPVITKSLGYYSPVKETNPVPPLDLLSRHPLQLNFPIEDEATTYDARAHQYHLSITPSHSMSVAHLKAEGISTPPTRPHTRATPSPPESSTCVDAEPTHTIPPVPLDPVLQAYFFRMRRASSQTLHPSQIHAEALHLVGLLTDPDDDAPDIKALAKLVFFAGTSRIEVCRSVALLMHDVQAELFQRSWDLRAEFLKELLQLAKDAFTACWDGKSNLDVLNLGNGITPLRTLLLEDMRTQILNVTAFFGALFSVEAIPQHVMQACVSMLAFHPRSITHCRALHLLLLFAGPQVGPPLDARYLETCAESLVWHARVNMRFAGDLMARRWLVEICRVIETTVRMDAEQEGGEWYARSATLRWDPHLQCQSLLGLLQ